MRLCAFGLPGRCRRTPEWPPHQARGGVSVRTRAQHNASQSRMCRVQQHAKAARFAVSNITIIFSQKSFKLRAVRTCRFAAIPYDAAHVCCAEWVCVHHLTKICTHTWEEHEDDDLAAAAVAAAMMKVLVDDDVDDDERTFFVTPCVCLNVFSCSGCGYDDGVCMLAYASIPVARARYAN